MRLSSWIVAVGLTLLLHGCGFRLRGSEDFGLAQVPVQLATASPYAEFEQMVRSALVSADAQLVEDAAATGALQLRILNTRVERRAVTTDSTGRAGEYQVTLLVDYQVTTAAHAADAETERLQTSREYRFDTSEVLSKSEEEAQLVTDMRRDLAARLLRRVAAVAKQLSATANP